MFPLAPYRYQTDLWSSSILMCDDGGRHIRTFCGTRHRSDLIFSSWNHVSNQIFVIVAPIQHPVVEKYLKFHILI